MSLELASEVGNVVLQAGDAGGPALSELGAAAIAVGLAAFGAGYSQRAIGAAAVGAMAENEDLFARGLILTVLPETLVILALLVVILLL
jgi:V/A-type H+-transporting ATPase subunit K